MAAGALGNDSDAVLPGNSLSATAPPELGATSEKMKATAARSDHWNLDGHHIRLAFRAMMASSSPGWLSGSGHEPSVATDGYRVG